MELWTRDGTDGWRRWPSVEVGLDALADRPAEECLVAAGEEPEDDASVCAVLRLLARLGAGPLGLTAGTEHPTASWYDAVRAAGAERAVLLPPADDVYGRESRSMSDVAEFGPVICPALGVRHAQGVAVSYCRSASSTLLLARRHLLRWCAAGSEPCPRRAGARHG